MGVRLARKEAVLVSDSTSNPLASIAGAFRKHPVSTLVAFALVGLGAAGLAFMEKIGDRAADLTIDQLQKKPAASTAATTEEKRAAVAVPISPTSAAPTVEEDEAKTAMLAVASPERTAPRRNAEDISEESEVPQSTAVVQPFIPTSMAEEPTSEECLALPITDRPIVCWFVLEKHSP